MSIVVKPDVDGTPRARYESPSVKLISENFYNLLQMFDEYRETCTNLTVQQVQVAVDLLGIITFRMERSKTYFDAVHKTSLNQVRETALLAYWINRFKPFSIVESETRGIERSDKNSAFSISSLFACYLILGSVRDYIKKRLVPDEEILARLKYGFKYWEISKEGMMMIAESMCVFAR